MKIEFQSQFSKIDQNYFQNSLNITTYVFKNTCHILGNFEFYDLKMHVVCKNCYNMCSIAQATLVHVIYKLISLSINMLVAFVDGHHIAWIYANTTCYFYSCMDLTIEIVI